MIRYEPQDHDDWLQWRKKGIGASDAAALIGVSPYENAENVWEKIVHGKTVFETEHMRRGKEIEKIIFPRIEAMVGHLLEEQVCGRSEDFPILQCTFDGLNEKEKLLVEIKYVSNKSRFDNLATVPKHHDVQMQQQMLISKLTKGLYVCTHDGVAMKAFWVNADPILQGKIINAAQAFWDNHVVTQIRPQVLEPAEEKDPVIVKRMRRIKTVIDKIAQLKKEETRLKEEVLSLAKSKSFICKGARFQVLNMPARLKYKELFEYLSSLLPVKEILSTLEMQQFMGDPGQTIRITYPSKKKEKDAKNQ
jgi:putative phage-type endonuclease